MKKFKVKTLYANSKMEVFVNAINKGNAKKHVEVFFKGSKVLDIIEVKEKKVNEESPSLVS